MPAELLTYVRGPYLTRNATAPVTFAISPEVLQEMLSLLHSHTGHSFATYKISTIRRRIERRLTLHQMTQPDHYLRYLREHPEELDTLFQELLIGVTSFFRDPEAFTVLASTVLPALLANKRDGEPVRVWVAGCSTGEEAYSLAMVLHECLGQLRKPCVVQIFATDLDAQAIAIARRGLYPEGIAADVTPERLQRYFTHADAAYRISKELRDMVIFAVHNLLTDPPFTHMDLLACRNLLIYLDTNAQHHLLSLFHCALRSGGVLFLGTSETIGNLGDRFTTLNEQWKIFARNDAVSLPYPLPEHAVAPFSPATRPPYSPGEPAQLGTLLNRAEAYLAQRFAPPSVLITAHGNIVHFHGRTSAYLEPPRGQPSLNIFRMAREGLDRVLTSAIRAALAQAGPVIRSRVGIKTNGETILTDVLIEQVPEPGPLQGLLLVIFRPAAVDAALAVAPERHAAPHRGRRRMVDLEQALQETRETLHDTIEELEATNEKLASTNEELQSTNEERQSANEELNSSREELQSLNEALQIANAELRSKVDDLSHANDDMTNLLNSTDIATIFLDDALQIKRFTTQATRMMALIPSDVGRPLSDLTSNLDYATLLDDAKQVLRTLVAHAQEVRTKNGVWYLVRILPYRTSALAAAYEELRRFAAMVSHDLRAPLINVQGFTRELAQACEVLQAVLPTAFPSLDNAQRAAVTTALEGDIPEALGFIRAGVARMDRLLEATVTLSRMGHRPLHPEAVDMEALVQQCLLTLAHQLRERQVDVTVGPLPQVHVDSLAMTQIVSNLLSNAINALVPGRPGELRITAAAGPESTVFHIQDNGRGIAAEDIPTVFELFRSLGSQNAAGAGMGLAYVRALVRRHGGDVGCQSTPGVGTTFTFTIAKHLAESHPPQHAAGAALP